MIAYFLLLISCVVIALDVLSGLEARKTRNTIKAQREQYVRSTGSNTRIVLNDGINLFYMDDDRKVFGVDDSGKTYSYAGLQSIASYKGGVSFYHMESYSIFVGDPPGHDTLAAISEASVNKICHEIMPVVKNNLYLFLREHNVSPTHEYEHQGEIWGCDIVAKEFYTNIGFPQVYDFDELKRVTVEDLSHNSLCSYNYLIHVVIRKKEDIFDMDTECDLYFQSRDESYYQFLAFFKGIRNRAYS